jgi:hypothetical protein
MPLTNNQTNTILYCDVEFFDWVGGFGLLDLVVSEAMEVS